MAGDLEPEDDDRALIELIDAGQVEHALRLQGKSWFEIAGLCGHETADDAYNARARYLQRAALDLSRNQKAEAIQLEVDRLDALQAVFWEAATTSFVDADGIRVGPDLKAGEFVLRIITTRAKVLGLDVPDASPAGPRTIVVDGTSEQYVTTLKKLIAGTAEVSDQDEAEAE